MEEYKQYGQRAHVFYQEDEQMEETATEGSPIGKLIVDNLMRNKPSDENTGKEAYNGKEYLTSNKVKPVEQRCAKQHQAVHCTQRQRAEGSNDGTGDGDYQGGRLARYMHFLMEEGRTDLVQTPVEKR